MILSVPQHFMTALGLMSPAHSPLAGLSRVYNLKMGDGDGTHISFYRSAGDRGLSSGSYMRQNGPKQEDTYGKEVE